VSSQARSSKRTRIKGSSKGASSVETAVESVAVKLMGLSLVRCRREAGRSSSCRVTVRCQLLGRPTGSIKRSK
jgi:hypothetical protein